MRDGVGQSGSLDENVVDDVGGRWGAGGRMGRNGE